MCVYSSVDCVATKDVKWLQGTRLLVLLPCNQLLKSFKLHNTHLFIDYFDIMIYELYTRW